VFDAAAPGTFGIEESLALATDTTVVPWPAFKSLLDKIIAAHPELMSDPLAKAAIVPMQEWNGVVTADSKAVLVFRGWTGRLADVCGRPFDSNGSSSWMHEASAIEDGYQALASKGDGTCGAKKKLVTGVIPALAGLGLLDSSGPAAWGKVHYLQLPGEKKQRSLGSGDRVLSTLFMSNASLSLPDYGVGATDSGSSYVMHVVLAPSLQVRTTKPSGGLSDPSDPRYGLMSDEFAAGKLRLVTLAGPSASAQKLER
jgi:hypothetical protein